MRKSYSVVDRKSSVRSIRSSGQETGHRLQFLIVSVGLIEMVKETDIAEVLKLGACVAC